MAERSARRNEIINRMLAMQKQFMDLERQKGFDGEEYYAAPANSFMDNYHKEYQSLAVELVDLAHSEVGSRR